MNLFIFYWPFVIYWYLYFATGNVGIFIFILTLFLFIFWLLILLIPLVALIPLFAKLLYVIFGGWIGWCWFILIEGVLLWFVFGVFFELSFFLYIGYVFFFTSIWLVAIVLSVLDSL